MKQGWEHAASFNTLQLIPKAEGNFILRGIKSTYMIVFLGKGICDIYMENRPLQFNIGGIYVTMF